MFPLATERLRTRPFTDADAPFVLEVHQHPGLRRFIPTAVCEDLDCARQRISRFQTYAEDPVLGVCCVTLTDGTPVGLLMVKPIPPSGAGHSAPEPGEEWDIEIGWRGHPSHGGHGYMAEAARAGLDNAQAHGLRRVVAVTHPENLASQRVAELAGLRRVGLTSAYYDEETTLFEWVAPQ